MAKVEIEVPEGKVPKVIKNNDKIVITFKEELLDRLKDVDSVLEYIKTLATSKGWAGELLHEYNCTVKGSYSEKLTIYRMVVAALTNNKKRHLTTGERWYPVVQFCYPKNVKNCYGNEIIGKIESEGQEFVVMGGYVDSSAHTGLGGFDSLYYVSASWARVGFRSVSSKKVAEHISKYFGKLLFEVQYGGVNCDWNWIE